MFELPGYVTLARQINEAVTGKTISRGALGNTPHEFVWYKRTHDEFAALTSGKRIGQATAKGRWLFVPLEPGAGHEQARHIFFLHPLVDMGAEDGVAAAAWQVNLAVIADRIEQAEGDR